MENLKLFFFYIILEITYKCNPECNLLKCLFIVAKLFYKF